MHMRRARQGCCLSVIRNSFDSRECECARVYPHPFSISFRSQFVLALSKLLLPWKLLECTNNIFPLRDRKQPETSPYKASSCFLARSDHSKQIFTDFLCSFSGAKTNKTYSALYSFWFASHLILESTYQYCVMLYPCAHANVSRPTQLHNSLLFSIWAIMVLIAQIYLNDPQFSVAVTLSKHSV